MVRVKMGTVWDRTTEFISDNLARVAPIALLLIFVPASIQGNLAPMVGEGSQATMLVIRLVGLALALVSLMGQLATVALAIDPSRTAREAATVARNRFLSAIIIAVVLVLGVVLLAVPPLLMLAGAGVDPAVLAAGTSAGVPPALPGAVVLPLGGYLFVVGLVSIWAAARLWLIYPVAVAEHRGVSAIGRSFALTRGLALPIIGVLMLYSVVSNVAALAAKTVFGSILALVAGGGDPQSVGSVLTSVIVAAVTTGFTVLSAAFVAHLYMAATGRAGHGAEPA